MDLMQVSVRKMESQLKEWGEKIEDLSVKSDNRGEQAKTDYYKRIDGLKSKWVIAQSRFDEFKAAGNGNGRYLGLAWRVRG